MEPVQTLHDFALNLLSDADAMSAFESDPTGVLQAAGLGDLTAGDVQEVLPLVLDYAADSDVTSGISGLTGAVDAVDQLDAAGLSGTDTNVSGLTTATTAMAENLTGDLTAGGVGLDDLGVDDFGVGDLGVGDLDSSALNEVIAGDTIVHGVTGSVSDLAAGDLGVTDLGGVESTVHDVTSTVGSGDVHLTDALDVIPTLDDTVTGDLSANPVTTLSDVASDFGNLSQLHDISNVGLNGDTTGIGAVTDVVGDLGAINVGGIGNGNDVDF